LREGGVRVKVVLVSPEGRINLGFIVRLAKNFGVDEICVVNPAFDVRHSEVIEFSANAADYIDRVRVVSSLSECLEGVTLSVCTTSKLNLEGDVLRQGVDVKELCYLLPPKGVLALVFGRESTGLTRSELLACDILSSIHTGSEYSVMNLSHAVAIYLYEVRKCFESTTASHIRYCREETLEALRSLIRYLGEVLREERGAIALKHILFKGRPSVEECSSIYKLLKRIKYGIRDRR